MNLLLYAGQIAVVVPACAAVHRLLRIPSAGVQYAFWRALLAGVLLLPILQPWHLPPARQAPPPIAEAISTVAVSVAAAAPAASARLDVDWSAVLLTIMTAGVLVRALWIAAGLVRLRRLRADAIAIAWDEADDLQRTIGTRASIGVSAAVRQPVTFGARRPVVLLPPSIADVPPAARRAVLAHELFHVRRRDWLWLLGEEVLRAAFWWHPAMWWLISRVQLAREAVVDELSILATNARRSYLDTLLACADAPPLAPAPAFARRRDLVHRITLLSREGTMSASRLFVACTVLMAALGVSGATAVRAFPLQQPPRDPVPGAYTSEQLAIFDRQVERLRAAIAREPNAPDLQHQIAVLLWNRASQDSRLSAAERRQYVSDAIAAENRALAVRPDYEPALRYKTRMLQAQADQTGDTATREVLLTQARMLEARAAAARQAAMPLPPPPPPPPPPGWQPPAPDPAFQATLDRLHPVRVGGAIKAPKKVKDVRAVYPPDAMNQRIEGVVILELIVDETGKVADERVLRSIPAFDQAALDAARQWEYAPTMLNGEPVAALIVVTVNFTLE